MNDIEFELEDASDEVELIEPPKKPQSHPVKQAIASFLDIPAGLVALPGLVQAGGTALTRLAKGESVEGSMDNALLRKSAAMREDVNDLMGIGEPETAVDQIARLASIVTPTPDKFSKVGSLLAKPGLAQKVGDVAGMIAMPFAQYSPEASTAVKMAQVGGQVGVGVAADQGMRALTDQPTVFGAPEPEFDIVDPDPEYDMEFKDEHELQRYKKDGMAEWMVGLGIGAAALFGARYYKRMGIQSGPFGALDPKSSDSIGLSAGQRAYAEGVSGTAAVEDVFRNAGLPEEMIDHVDGIARTDAQKQAEMWANTGKLPDSVRTSPIYMQDVELPLNQLAPDLKQVFDEGMLAIRERLNRTTATFKSYFGDEEAFQAYTKKQFQYFAGKKKEALDEVNKLETAVQVVMHETPDDIGTLNDIQRKLERHKRYTTNLTRKMLDWKLAGETGTLVGKSGKVYDLNDYWSNSPDLSAKQMREFIEDTNTREIPTGLLIKREGGEEELAKSAELDLMIKKLRENPQLMGIARKYAEIMDSLLQHGVDQKIFSKEHARKLRLEMTYDDIPFFIPGHEVVRDMVDTSGMSAANSALEHIKTMGVRLAKTFGWTSSSARDVKMDIIGHMNQRAMDAGMGILKPMSPQEVLQLYASSIFNHIHKNKTQAIVLDNLSSTLADRAARLDPVTGKPMADDGLIVRRVGMSEEPDPPISRDLVNDLKGKNLEIEGNTITIQRNGQFEKWYVSDPTIRAALDFSPRIVEGINGIAAKFKNLFHMATTRNILFAPTQWLYSTQQLGATSLAHGTWFSPLDAAKGSWEILSTNIARETAAHLRKMLYTNTGLAEVNRPMVEGLVAKLENHFAKSFYDNFNRESGGLHSAYTTQEVLNKLPDLGKHYGEVYRDPAKWKIAWRYLDILHQALQEGPMMGLQMKLADKTAKAAGKEVADLTPAELRRVNSQSKHIGGDFRDIGTSAGARTVASWVPYSGAILHGWSALGRAAKKDPKKFMAGLFTYVVAPTLAELVAWHFLAGEDEKRAYWTRYTDEQRAGNFLAPTGDATTPAMFRVLPEFGPIRTATIAAFDTMLGLSNDYRGLPGDANIGTVEPATKKDYQHAMMVALARAFNIPTPPLVNAALATQNTQLTIGPTASEGDGTLIHLAPLGGTEKVSGVGRGDYRLPDGVLDRPLEGIISSLLGFYGTTLAATAEAFDQGTRKDLGTGLDFAADELGERVSQYANLTNPFTGSASHTSSNDATEQRVRLKTQGLKDLALEFQRRMTGGRIVNTSNMMNFPSDSALPSFNPNLDIISTIAANSARINVPLETHVKDLQKVVTDLRGGTIVQPAVVHTVPEFEKFIGEPLTPSLKREMIDAVNFKIKSYRELMLAKLISIEVSMEEALKANGYDGGSVNLQDFNSRGAAEELAPTLEDVQAPSSE